MGFSLVCDNKGCGKTQESLLDVKTDEIICQDCGGIIDDVSPFIKRQMKSMGQIKRDSSGQESFSISCPSCKKSGKPHLVNNKVVCKFCKSEMTQLARPYTEMLKSMLKG